MFKKIVFIIFLVPIICSAQNKASYEAAIRKANQYFIANDYISALIKYQAAAILAQENHLDSKLADEGADRVMEVLKEEHEALLNYKRLKETAESQLKLVNLKLQKLNEVIQDDRNTNLPGFGPLKTKLLDGVIGIQKILTKNPDMAERLITVNAQLAQGETAIELGNTEVATNNFSIAYFLAKKCVDETLAGNEKPNQQLWTAFFASAVNNGTWLINRGDMTTAAKVIEDLKSRSNSNLFEAADYADAMSAVSSMFALYYQQSGRYTEAFSFRKQAFKYQMEASARTPDDAKLKNKWIAAILAIANADGSYKIVTDSINYYLNIAGRKLAQMKSYASLQPAYIRNTASYNMLRAENLYKQKNFRAAVDTLETTLKPINEFLKYNPSQYGFYLIRADIRLAIARNSEMLPDLRDKALLNINMASEDLIGAVKGKIYLPEDPAHFQKEMAELVDFVERISTTKKYGTVLKDLLSVVTPTAQKYTGSAAMSYIVARLNYQYGRYLIGNKSKQDSLLSNSNFSKAIYYYNNAKLLENTSSYQQDYAWLCRSYYQRLSSSLRSENKAYNDSLFKFIIKTFPSIQKKYDYDSELSWALALVGKEYGNYLFRKGLYQTAITPLTLASNEGVRSSTDLLVKIYGSNGRKDAEKLNYYLKRSEGQIGDERKPLIFYDASDSYKNKITIYLVDRPEGYPYRGIDDQAKWLAISKGILLDTVYTNTFRRYQDIAWKNHRSFVSMSDDAFDEAGVRLNYLNKYVRFKRGISTEKNLIRKFELCQRLYDTYEADMAKDERKSNELKRDAATFYITYAALIKQNDGLRAKNLYQRVLELDATNASADSGLTAIFFLKNRGAVLKSGYKNDIGHLRMFLQYFLKEGDIESANNVTAKILQQQDDAEIRDQINHIYFKENKYDNFDELFLNNNKRVKEFLTYFISKNTEITGTIQDRRKHFFKIVKLDGEYQRINPKPDPTFEKALSESINAFAWYSILAGERQSVMFYLNRSLQLNPDNAEAIVYQAHLYLLNNDYERCKSIYVRYALLPFDGTKETFKDKILADFKAFNDAGVRSNYLAQVTKLLNQKNSN